LDQYREQYQVETAFRWLKQPGAVAPMFLHKPSRLAALGLVFALALAVYRIIQHRVRTALAKMGQTIPGNNHQPTNKPTTAVVAKLFHNVHRIIVPTPQGQRVWLHGLTPAHELVLAILELPVDLGLSEKPCGYV
jgi:transposase